MRKVAIDLLSNLKSTLELKQELDQEERELIMQLSPVYEQQLAEAREQGVQAERCRTIDTLEIMLRMKFGTVDEELAAVIQLIIDLPSPEYAALLLQLPSLSREELLARFA